MLCRKTNGKPSIYLGERKRRTADKTDAEHTMDKN